MTSYPLLVGTFRITVVFAVSKDRVVKRSFSFFGERLPCSLFAKVNCYVSFQGCILDDGCTDGCNPQKPMAGDAKGPDS